MSVGSDDLLVAEEVPQVGDLNVGADRHYHERDHAEGHHAALDQLILRLQCLLADDQVVHLSAQLLDHVSDLLGGQLDWLEVLLRDDVGVVRGLHARRHAKTKRRWTLRVVVHHADLVVPIVEASEVISELCLVFLRH